MVVHLNDIVEDWCSWEELLECTKLVQGKKQMMHYSFTNNLCIKKHLIICPKKVVLLLGMPYILYNCCSIQYLNHFCTCVPDNASLCFLQNIVLSNTDAFCNHTAEGCFHIFCGLLLYHVLMTHSVALCGCLSLYPGVFHVLSVWWCLICISIAVHNSCQPYILISHSCCILNCNISIFLHLKIQTHFLREVKNGHFLILLLFVMIQVHTIMPHHTHPHQSLKQMEPAALYWSFAFQPKYDLSLFVIAPHSNRCGLGIWCILTTPNSSSHSVPHWIQQLDALSYRNKVNHAGLAPHITDCKYLYSTEYCSKNNPVTHQPVTVPYL